MKTGWVKVANQVFPILTQKHFGTGKASAPSASLHYRHAEPKPFVTPAPGSYCPEKAEKKILDASPKFSFGVKPKSEIKSSTPGILMHCFTVITWADMRNAHTL